MSDRQLSQNELKKMAWLRLLVAISLLSAMFFLPAGTFAYWEAWGYLAVLFFPVLSVLNYLLKNDPELLERRMRMKEKRKRQKLIIKVSYIYFLLMFLLPGFDKRFGWSNVPVGVVVIADILVLLGYGIFFRVLRENRYASRTIEIVQEQKVIRSGPYAIVRHPMYLGLLLMYTFSPLALGSYWATIPALMMIPLLVVRIWDEERLLLKDLDGYKQYTQETRYRLIPGVW